MRGAQDRKPTCNLVNSRPKNDLGRLRERPDQVKQQRQQTQHEADAQRKQDDSLALKAKLVFGCLARLPALSKAGLRSKLGFLAQVSLQRLPGLLPLTAFRAAVQVRDQLSLLLWRQGF